MRGQAFLTEAAVGESVPSPSAVLSTTVTRATADKEQQEQDDAARRLINHVPFCGSLASFLTDPLDLTADESSPLIQELRNIEASVSFGGQHRTVAAGDASASLGRRRRGDGAARKPSHRMSPRHQRALAMRSVPPLGMNCRPLPLLPPRKSEGVPFERAPSQMTEVSVQMARTELLPGMGQAPSFERRHLDCCPCRGCAPVKENMLCASYSKGVFDSLADTSIGPMASLEEFSRDMPSEFSRELPAEPSIQSAALDVAPHWAYPGASESAGVPGDDACELQAAVVQRSRITAVEEIRRAPAGAVPEKRRVLHVAQPPYHDCVAFDAEDIEKERAQSHKEVPQALHPDTKRRLQDLQEVGSFPRRWLQGGYISGGSLTARGPSHGGTSASAAPRTGPPPRGGETQQLLASGAAIPAGWRRFRGEGDLSPAPGQAPRLGARDTVDMVDYFPASAR